MPEMTFDLLDGRPPVSLMLSARDAERFAGFMGECYADRENADALLARIAELEEDLRISRDASRCLEANRDRLRAEVEALRAGIEKAMIEIDDAGPKALKYARQELETAIAQPSTPWVNPLAAEVKALRASLDWLASEIRMTDMFHMLGNAPLQGDALLAAIDAARGAAQAKGGAE